MCEDYTGERFQPVLTTKGSEMIVQYDEHRLTNNFKFGIIYQTFKQVSNLYMYQTEWMSDSGLMSHQHIGQTKTDLGLNSNPKDWRSRDWTCDSWIGGLSLYPLHYGVATCRTIKVAY